MRRLVAIANAVLILAIVAVVAFEIVSDRERVLADTTADAKNLRDALVEHTRQTLSAVNIMLGGVAEDIDTTDLGGKAAYESLAIYQEAFAPTFAVFVLDGEGRLAATSRTREPRPVDFSAETMFTAHRDDPSPGLHIAPPRKGRVGYAKGRWIANVSRRLNHPDGSFAGIVAAAVSIDYLTDFYDALRVGEQGVVGLFGDDATVIARSPFDEAYIGAALSDTKLVRELLSERDAGVYRAPFVTDRVDRIVAYSRVEDYPAVVYVGISADERLAGWIRRALVDGTVGLLAIVLVTGLSVLLVRRLRERQDEAEARARHLARLTEASSSLIGSPDVETALRRATELARDLVPSHQAVTSLTEHPSMTRAIHTVSLSHKYADWQDYGEKPARSGIYRQVAETNAPIRLTQAELEAHPAWREFGEARERHPPMRGLLAVPLIADDGGNLGLMQLSDRYDGEFTIEDEALLAELAHITSVAVQKLELEGDLREAVNEADRLRVEAVEAQAAEERAREEIETIFTSITDAVFGLDTEWRFTFLNRQAEEVLERKAEDLVGRNMWEEFPEGVETVAYAHYHRARTENVDVDFEVHYPPLRRWFHVRAFPHEEGLTVYFQDVSDRVLQEQQLRQAQKMEAVGQLTGGVAHDFNNLLTVILGNADVVAETLDKDSQNYRLVSMIRDAGERAADLTQRLLAFSRRQPLDPKAVDVNALVHELEPLLRRTLGEHYDIEIACQEGIEPAIVDPAQLQSAIVNLAVNARDAMPEGGRLTIETAEIEIDEDYIESHVYAASGRYAMIAVGDNGSGMTPEVRSRAFEPFFTTKKTGVGTGLGLSMVFGFIKQSNGHVNIYSEAGEGTTIKLYLPCGDGANVTDWIDGDDRSVHRGSERVLVVEDEMLVREYTASTLTSLGYDVTAVADGPAARAVLETDAGFDLLLCDVILGGGMNGREVADAAHELVPQIRVLYMSGYTENAVVHQGRLDPGVRLLLKPFRRVDLAAKVREVLDESLG